VFIVSACSIRSARYHDFIKTYFSNAKSQGVLLPTNTIRKGNTMLTRNVLLGEHRDWLASLKPNVFLTFNFGYLISPEVGGDSVIRLFNRLQRGVHGRNWSTRKTERYMIAVGFWEHVDSNPHVHVVGRMSKDERAWLRDNGENAWLERQRRGQLDFSKIVSREKVISYITKDFSGPDSQQRMFTYKAPLNESLSET
jgi:hypothetical protein